MKIVYFLFNTNQPVVVLLLLLLLLLSCYSWLTEGCNGDNSLCNENAECIKKDGRYVCECKKGYKGSDCKTCKHCLWKSAPLQFVSQNVFHTMFTSGHRCCQWSSNVRVSLRPCWRAETMKQFCMKIDLISQGRENVLFLRSNMAAMTSHENAP